MKRADFVTEKTFFPRDAALLSPRREDGTVDGRYEFRAVLTLPEKPRRALMILTGSDCFDVSLGGEQIAEYALRSYVYHRAYEVYDVTSALGAGENAISVLYFDGKAPINRGFVCEFFVDGARVPLDWSCRRDEVRGDVPHFISGGGFEIFDATAELGEFKPCKTKKYELPSGVSLYQSVQPPQEKCEIYPLKEIIGGASGRFGGEYYKFKNAAQAVYFAEFFAAGGEKPAFKAICGVHSAYIDGREIVLPCELDEGRHTVAVFSRGGECAFALGATAEFFVREFPAPRAPYRYPWNDSIQMYKIPNDVSEFIKNTAISKVLPAAPRAERIVTPSYADVIAHGGNGMVYDFGRERVGYIKIEFESPRGATVYFRTFELLTERGARDMGEKSGGAIVAGEGKCSFTSSRLRGFRYAEVFVPGGADARDLTVSMIEEKYGARDAGAFASSDEKLDEIYKISLDTAAVCMLDSYVDCPGYEQNIWTGDAAITGKINMVSFGAREFDARYLDTVAHSMLAGLCTYYRGSNPLYVNDTYLPCACFPTYPDGGIPAWSFSWVTHVVDHIVHFGTGGTDALVAAVEECLRRAELHFSPRGLFAPLGAWNLIDWASNDFSPYGEVSANNMMLCGCYTNVSHLFALLGETEKSRIYLEKSEKLKENINKYCWDPARRAYVDTVRDGDGYSLYLDFCKFKNRTPETYEKYLSLSRVSVQTATFALLYDIADGARRDACEKILVDDISRGNFRAGTPAKRTFGTPGDAEAPGGVVRIGTPFFLYYALGALFKIGKHELALDAIRREWGEMISDGLKTCVETFKNTDGGWGRSIAHAWSAAPAVFLKTEILGVKPCDLGYRKFTVEPHPCGLTHAEGAVPTPHGNIVVKWRASGGKIDIEVDAPKECERI